MIKLIKPLTCMGMFFIAAVVSLQGAATNRYVATNAPSPGYPYDSWAKAGTNIIDVVNVANANNAGDMVIISNGIYYLTNQIAITGYVIVTNFTGDRAQVIINGNYPNTTNRCFNISNVNAVVDGFTITNGVYYPVSYSYGGGIYISAGEVRNCLITGNAVSNKGGGVYFNYGGILTNCLIQGNQTSTNNDAGYGGGVYCEGGGLLKDCMIISNKAQYGGGMAVNQCGIVSSGTVTLAYNTAERGAGLMFAGGAIVKNFNIYSNTASSAAITFGGGLYVGSACTVEYCSVVGNQANYGGGMRVGGDSSTIVRYCTFAWNRGNYGGGIDFHTGSCVVRNCLITHNTGTAGGGAYFYKNGITENCTVVSNMLNSGGLGGGVYCHTENGGTGTVVNTIIYYNAPSFQYSNYYNNAVGIYSNCCFTPVLSGASTNYSANNITSEPLFINYPAGNYRLLTGSPCIDAGLYQSWMDGALDLDGRRRIRDGTVDMGVYEHINEGTIYKLW